MGQMKLCSIQGYNTYFDKKSKSPQNFYLFSDVIQLIIWTVYTWVFSCWYAFNVQLTEKNSLDSHHLTIS
jgi:hypothetical protein